MQNATFTELEARCWMSHACSAAVFRGGEGRAGGQWHRDSTSPTAVHAGWDVAHCLSRLLGRSSRDSVPPPHVALSPAPCQPPGLSPKPRAEPWDPAAIPHPGCTTSCLAPLKQSLWDMMLRRGHGSSVNGSAAPRLLPAVFSAGATKPHYFCSEEWAVMEAAVKAIARALFDAEWHQQAHGRY